jgi:hypothetical protein
MGWAGAAPGRSLGCRNIASNKGADTAPMTRPPTAPPAKEAVSVLKRSTNQRPAYVPATHPRVEAAIVEGIQRADHAYRRQRKPDCANPASVPPTAPAQNGSRIRKPCASPAQIPTAQAADVAGIHAGDKCKRPRRASHCAAPMMAPHAIHAQGPCKGVVAPTAALHPSTFHAIHWKTNRFSMIRVCRGGRAQVLREGFRICYEMLISDGRANVTMLHAPLGLGMACFTSPLRLSGRRANPPEGLGT